MKILFRPQVLLIALLSVTVLSSLSSAPSSSHATYATIYTQFQYLPEITQNAISSSIFGATMIPISTEGGLDRMARASTEWTRRTISWNKVEANPGNRIWSAVADMDVELQNAASNNVQVILTIEDTPAWALKPGYSCNAVAENRFSYLAKFMTDLVKRYSVSPFNIHYYEMWNEPDVVGILGCWGDANDDYYGGGYYGSMLKAVYSKVKAADSQAQVLVGGLLLDYNPSPGSTKISPLFLKGILQNGGGSYFDGVSFHAYDYYHGEGGKYDNTGWNSYWNSTGPATTAKATYIRGLLQQYGVAGKYLMNTEVALLCGSTGSEPVCLAPEYEQTKSAYLVREYAAAIRDNLRANLWFTAVFGWRGSALLNNDLSPRSSYQAYKFAAGQFGTASATDINPTPYITGFDLNRRFNHIWLVWSVDGTPQTLDLPSNVIAIYDDLGNSVDISSPLTLDWRPTYIVVPNS